MGCSFNRWSCSRCISRFAKTSLNSVEKKKVHYPDEKLSKVYEKFIPYYLETMDKMNEVFEKYRELL